MKPDRKRRRTIKNTSVQQPPARNLYDILNGFFERNHRVFFMITMVLSVLMSFCMFDLKISLSGDDTDYVLSADAFWHHFTFPGFRGPLYPIILSPIVGIFGMKLALLKSFSALFILLSIWLFYKSFLGKVPAVVLMPSLLLVSVCSYVFFYATYTYSEPLFMLTQGLYVYFFSKYFLDEEKPGGSLKTDYYKYLVLGALALCISLTRSIGYGIIGVVALYFIIKLRWKDLLYTLAASILIFGLFQIFKSVVWPEAGAAYDIKAYLAKDLYNLNAGMEDLPGFCNRFIINSQIYLSAFLCQFMGIMPETASNYADYDPWRTVLIYLLYIICIIAVFRRNNALLFTGLYAGIMNLLSFVLLQTIWGQDRLIMIYYPFILIFLLGGICCLLRLEKLRKFFFLYPIIVMILCVGTLIISKNRIERNLPILQENILGNPFYGWTPDWQNFVLGSQWAVQNLEKDAVIVSRKGNISKIYTGRDFSGVPVALTLPNDTLERLRCEDCTLLVSISRKPVLPGKYLKYVVFSQQHFSINGQNAMAVSVYVVPNRELEQAIERLTNAQTPYTSDYNAFLTQCKKLSTLRVYDPDMMLQYLIDAKIDYLLLPQLR
ncbi:MAG: hypothetical protein LBD27_02515, partial [Tannerella sp.]|nr:hypothetical protein [Tannerella sp.]